MYLKILYLLDSCLLLLAFWLVKKKERKKKTEDYGESNGRGCNSVRVYAKADQYLIAMYMLYYKISLSTWYLSCRVYLPQIKFPCFKIHSLSLNWPRDQKQHSMGLVGIWGGKLPFLS